MERLMRFPGAVPRDAAIDAWMAERDGELGQLAHYWFEAMRSCGDDVRELLHDGYPTACIGDAAFGYVGVFQAHVNVGFFKGADLEDPHGLLVGTGKFMRHVKLRPVKLRPVKLCPGQSVDAAALLALLQSAAADMRARIANDR